MRNHPSPNIFLAVVKLLVLTSAFAYAAGWLLSACRILDGRGYSASLIVFGAVVLLFRNRLDVFHFGQSAALSTLRARFKRPLPRLFFVLAFLILLGGLLYAPSNYDALCYRMPRLLAWLSEHGWHWIHGPDQRMNNRACGFEWLSAPLLLLTKSDRALFLINYIHFLLLPGLFFGIATRLGVGKRAAWNWMWILPSGYCFILQAGSIANDSFMAVYALAAIYFALRARLWRRLDDIWISILAAGVLTGSKASALPLLLPWAIAIFPVLPQLWSDRLRSLVMVAVAMLASFLPTALLNLHYCGDWTGLKLEHEGTAVHQPLVGLLGNSLAILIGNFTPAIFPWAGRWNSSFLEFFPSRIVTVFNANFETGFHAVGELPMEEWSGLGFGVSVLLVISIVAALRCRKSIRQGFDMQNLWHMRLLQWSPLAALLTFFCRSGIGQLSRIAAPYYLAIIPLLLIGSGHDIIVRRYWWKTASQVVILLAMLVVIVCPARPLWPAQAILTGLGRRLPHNAPLARAQEVYAIYALRQDIFRPIREILPAGTKVIGMACGNDDAPASLYYPFSVRRVVYILPNDTRQAVLREKIEVAVVSDLELRVHDSTINQWLEHFGGEVLSRRWLTLKLRTGSQEWYVVKMQ
jgi:hypothetical protein